MEVRVCKRMNISLPQCSLSLPKGVLGESVLIKSTALQTTFPNDYSPERTAVVASLLASLTRAYSELRGVVGHNVVGRANISQP